MSFETGGSIEMGANGIGTVNFNSKQIVRFHLKPEIDKAASEAGGRPIHRDVVYCSIRVVGEKDEFDQPATEDHKMRFPVQWQQFQKNQPQEIQGTPLSVLFPANPSIIRNLNAVFVMTVEQLANLNDTQLQNAGMGARGFQEKAKAFIAQAEKTKGFHAINSELEKRDIQIAALQAQLNSIVAGQQPQPPQIPPSGVPLVSTEQPKKRRGRPPKVKATQET